MATIAEFQIPTEDAAFGTAFDEIPSLVCDVERAIATDTLGVWVSGADLADINAAFDADPSIESYTVVAEDNDRWLCDITVSTRVADLVSGIVDAGGTLLEAEARDAVWTLRLRFPNREDASRVFDRLQERDIPVDISRIQSLSPTADGVGLTPDQREAIAAAIQHGYFEVPRDISLGELADELDVSHQALSERFRRAYQTLATEQIDLDELAQPHPSAPKHG